MSRYFVTFSYDGTRYHGWQIQPNGVSVQERLQEARDLLASTPIETVDEENGEGQESDES